MTGINSFVNACGTNEVREVRRMISEGVDINGMDSKYGVTGLMKAMMRGHTEVVRILLCSNNIKIDIKNRSGTSSTALHLACYYNHVECVELFLAHNTCTKAIAMMEDSEGETAQMWAN